MSDASGAARQYWAFHWAFADYDIGYGSAIVVVFFVLNMLVGLVPVELQQLPPTGTDDVSEKGRGSALAFLGRRNKAGRDLDFLRALSACP